MPNGARMKATNPQRRPQSSLRTKRQITKVPSIAAAFLWYTMQHRNSINLIIIMLYQGAVGGGSMSSHIANSIACSHLATNVTSRSYL